jgi:hypothetical protein
MLKTKQRTIRLSVYHLKILEQIQESLGLTFSDAIRHLISNYEQQSSQEKRTDELFRQFEIKLSKVLPSKDHTNSPINAFKEIRSEIALIKKAITIIGASDPRTKVLIENLLSEKAHEKS